MNNWWTVMSVIEPLYMYRIAIASALLMIIKYLYFLHAELFQTDHYIILKQLKATCLSDLKIIRLKKFLCQLNWTSSIFFLSKYYQNGQNVVVSAYSTDPSWGRTDRQLPDSKGGNFGEKFTLLRGFWLDLYRIIFLTREKTSIVRSSDWLQLACVWKFMTQLSVRISQ